MKATIKDAISEYRLPEKTDESRRKEKPTLHLKKRKNRVNPEYQPHVKKCNIPNDGVIEKSKRDIYKTSDIFSSNHINTQPINEPAKIPDQCAVTLRVHEVKVRGTSVQQGLLLTEREVKKALSRLDSIMSASSIKQQGNDWIINVVSTHPQVPGVKFNCRGRVYKIETM